jgi:secreted trypsin-like serine protease
MKSALILVLVAFAGQVFAQKNFVVDVVNYANNDFNTSVFLCYGTMISSRHVLAPANCINTSGSRSIAIVAMSLGAKNQTTYSKKLRIDQKASRLNFETFSPRRQSCDPS